jgi:Beta-propeller repeat
MVTPVGEVRAMKCLRMAGLCLSLGCLSLWAAADNPDSMLWSTFLGGDLGDINQDLITDSLGDVYVCGTTQSANFPTTPGAYDTTFNGGTALEYGGDTWVAKFDGVTGALIYSTFIGGPDDEEPDGIMVNAAGEVIVLGLTASPSFPTTPGAYDTTHNGGIDSYVIKLSAAGDALLFSTFLGGTDDEESWEKTRIGLDPGGNIYITGLTCSADWPATPGAFDTTHNGPVDNSDAARDVFVAKLSADGSTLLYGTFLGGSDRDQGLSLAVSPTGEACVTGFTDSVDFPTTPGAYSETSNGARDVFVTRLSADASSLVYSTRIGGASNERAWDMTLDISGDVYVAGGTGSLDYPTTPGAYQTVPTGNDIFVTRLLADGTNIVQSTLLGGNAGIIALSLDRDANNNIWVAGETSSTDLPTTPLAFLSAYNGGPRDGYVAQFNSSLGNLVYCSYVGGSGWEPEGHIALDAMGNIVLGGRTTSADFPLSPGAADSVFGGDGVNTGESYVLKLDPGTIDAHYLTLFESEMELLYTSLGQDYLTADLDTDGLPDLFQAGLVAYVLSIKTHPYSNAVETLYVNTIAALQAEPNYATQLAPYEHALAALLITSEDMITYFTASLSLTGSYSSFKLTKDGAKALDEPFSGQGDLDGDGLSNAEEYGNVVIAGGAIEEFMLAAVDPTASGKALSAASQWALLVLTLAIGLVAGRRLRARRSC